MKNNMTQKERVKEALELLNSHKMHHVEVSYGPDCQVYKDYDDVVSIHIAKLAIEIATGKNLGL